MKNKVFTMKCPYCGFQETAVLETRDSEEAELTKRRRECEKCKKRFTTYERVELIDLAVIKKDGKKEPFNRDKLFTGIKKACWKTPVTNEQIEKIVDEILLRQSANQDGGKAVNFGEAMKLVMAKLKGKAESGIVAGIVKEKLGK